MFTGDLLHTPVQLAEPDWSPGFDEDEVQARITRRRVLEWAANHTALVLPAHFPAGGAVEVKRDGSKFAINGWAAVR